MQLVLTISPFANSDYDALWIKSCRSPENKLEEANVHMQCGELRCFNKYVFYLSTFVDCLILIPTLCEQVLYDECHE